MSCEHTGHDLSPDQFPAFLEADLGSPHTLEVEDFFRTILGASNRWVDDHHSGLERTVGDGAFQSALAAYSQTGRNRGDGVEAFERLADDTVKLLLANGLLGVEVPVTSVPCKSPYSHPRPDIQGDEVTATDGSHCHLQYSNTDLEKLRYRRRGYWSFDLVSQPTLFVIMLCGLGGLFAGAKALEPGPGGICVVRPPTHAMPEQDMSAFGACIRLTDGCVLQTGDILHQPGLLGRATCVVRATQVVRGSGSDCSGKKLIVKLAWSPTDRRSEVKILELARRRAVEIGQMWILDHLPLVVHCQEYLGVDDDLRSRLADYLGQCYEQRHLRVIVEEEPQFMTQLLYPIELGIVINDVLRCYKWLYQECRILHRDTSHSNVMFRTKDGTIKRVPNEFDLASVGFVDDPCTASHGTGTKLFMAIELLRAPRPPHYFRHDLESLMYVLLWHASQHPNGAGFIAGRSTYERWRQACPDILEAYKIRFVHCEAPRLTAQFELLSTWIQRLQLLFRRGFQARNQARQERDSDFDKGTLGEVVTFDAFETICSESLQEIMALSAGSLTAHL